MEPGRGLIPLVLGVIRLSPLDQLIECRFAEIVGTRQLAGPQSLVPGVDLLSLSGVRQYQVASAIVEPQPEAYVTQADGHGSPPRRPVDHRASCASNRYVSIYGRRPGQRGHAYVTMATADCDGRHGLLTWADKPG